MLIDAGSRVYIAKSIKNSGYIDYESDPQQIFVGALNRDRKREEKAESKRLNAISRELRESSDACCGFQEMDQDIVACLDKLVSVERVKITKPIDKLPVENHP